MEHDLAKKSYSFALSNLDDSTLYNVYQIFQNEKFWEERFIKKFGLINAKHKPEFMLWKDFSLQILYYIDKGENDLNKAMLYAVEDGKKDIVEILSSNGAFSWELGIIYAAKKGYEDIIDFFQEKIIQKTNNS